MLSVRAGVEGWVTSIRVFSKGVSTSGISDGSNNGLLGGNGEGERGPIGRRSDEC